MATERIGRAVLELTTDASGLLSGFATIQREGKGVETEFERLRQRSRDLGRDLQRAVDGFEGAPLVNKARTMAQAIEQVGGVSKLTKRELADVAHTVAAATDKLERMGQDVPPSLRRLSAEIKGLDENSGKASRGGLSSMTGALGGLKSLLPALGIASAVALVGSMGAAALQSADKFVTFAERADVSVETTQRWAYVAGQTSTSLEAFGANAFKLGVNVSAGTDKVRSAVSELGLSYAELRAQKPEQQFDTVIEKLEGVEKATDRNRIGQALFGKQFSEIAVAVSEGYTRMKDDASVASEEQVRAAEAAGDAWEQVKQQIGAASLTVVGGLSQYVLDTIAAMKLLAANREDFTPVQQALIDQVSGAGGEGLSALLDSFKGQAKDINLAASAVTDYTARLREVRAEVAALTPAQREQIAAASQLTGVTDELADELGVSIEALRLYSSESKKKTAATKEDTRAEDERLAFLKKVALGDYFEKLYGTAIRADIAATTAEIRAEIQAHENTADVLYFGILPAVGITTAAWVQQYVPALAASEAGTKRLQAGTLSLAKALREQLLTSLQQVPGTLAQALVSGGGISGAAKSIASNLGSNLAKWGAAALGFTGPWGQAIAGAVGSLAPMISKLWGGNAQHKQVNDLRDEFTKTAGGIGALDAKAKAAGLTLDRFLRAKTVKDYEAAINELTDAFKRQEDQLAENKAKAGSLFDEIMSAGAEGLPAAMRPAIEQLIALGLLTDEQAAKLRGLKEGGVNVDQMMADMETLGGRMESLGPAFAQAKLDQTSDKYINAIDRLIKGGGDVGGVLFDAKEELSALAAESIKTGRTLPENLRPWLDDLAKSGNLLDENGGKITDLSGIKFGPAIKTQAEIAKEGWDKILAKIDELITRIGGPLTQAIDHATRDRSMNVDLTVRERTRREDEQESQPEGERTPHYDTGIFRGKFSAAGTLARLHNIESVVPKGDELSFAMKVLTDRAPTASPNTGGGQQITVAPLAMFYPDVGGRFDLSAINRHLASAAGIAGNNFGLREAIESVALGVFQREVTRRG